MRSTGQNRYVALGLTCRVTLWKSEVILRAFFNDFTADWMIGFGLDFLRFIVQKSESKRIDSLGSARCDVAVKLLGY